MAANPPLIVSRRAFQRLSQQYPQYFESSKKNALRSGNKASTSKKKEDTPWPKSLQIAGYSAIALSIPYTIGTIISESPRLRDLLEEGGDSNGDMTLGQSVVSWVRWGWGDTEIQGIPYVESSHPKSTVYESNSQTDDTTQLISLKNDVPSKVRSEQAIIQQNIQSNVKVRMNTISNDRHQFGDDINAIVGEEKTGYISGETMLTNSDNIYTKMTGNEKEPSQHLTLLFEDDDQEMYEKESMNGASFSEQVEDTNTSAFDQLKSLTSIWSLWYINPTASSTTTTSNGSISTKSTSNANRYDATQLRIDELEYDIADLRKALQDPLTTRSIDDMEQEITLYRDELRTLKRQRRLQKLGNLVGRK